MRNVRIVINTTVKDEAAEERLLDGLHECCDGQANIEVEVTSKTEDDDANQHNQD